MEAMTALYLDIETIPTQRQDVCDYLSTSLRDDTMKAMEAVCAPSNYKDADKIAQYIADKKAALQAEFADKLKEKIDSTGLDGSFGQVFCVGWAVDNDQPSTSYGMNEREVLEDFARLLNATIPISERHATTVIGHNVSSFDLRFLSQRFIVHGIRPPMVIARAAAAKPWEIDRVFDTMIQWAGVGGRISLERLCLALSLPSPKGELDGSKVWQYVQDGKHDEVARYCERDVETTRTVHRRMTFQTVEVFEDVPA
jgi:DNA polymerase elongation subunit (family B)